MGAESLNSLEAEKMQRRVEALGLPFPESSEDWRLLFEHFPVLFMTEETVAQVGSMCEALGIPVPDDFGEMVKLMDDNPFLLVGNPNTAEKHDLGFGAEHNTLHQFELGHDAIVAQAIFVVETDQHETEVQTAAGDSLLVETILHGEFVFRLNEMGEISIVPWSWESDASRDPLRSVPVYHMSKRQLEKLFQILISDPTTVTKETLRQLQQNPPTSSSKSNLENEETVERKSDKTGPVAGLVAAYFSDSVPEW